MANSYLELLELSKCLKKEKLFVESEKAQIQDLNKKVMKAVEELHHLSWITRQQQLNLEGLILSRAGATPAACCRRDSMLHTANFVDSYKLLGPTDPFYSELLGQLRGQPALVARVLLLGERTAAGDQLTSLVDIVYSGIYGNGILREDELSLLQVLRQLMVRQVAPAEQPQRLLRRGSCVFSRVYKAFSEGLFAAKLFLTSALHQPVMKLLMADEWYLDIDPNKVDEGLSDGEGRPGQPNAVAAAGVSAEDVEAERERRRAAVADRLAALTDNFISHISAAAACFPPSLAWVVRSLHDLLRKGSSCTAEQVNAMCVDLLFAFFICPAVVDPVQYGILEAPVGPVARHNLIQVGQILQTLAMNQCDEVEPRLRPFYHRFDKAAVASLLGHVLESGGPEPEPGPEPVLEPPSQLVGLARSAVLVTRAPLDHLVSLMRQLAVETTDAAEKKLLDGLTAHLPSAEQPPPPPPPPPAAAPAPAHGTPPHQTHGGSRRSRILDKVQTSVQRRSSMRSPATSAGAGAAAAEPAQQPEEPPLEVLVVALNTPGTCPGMISEQKVLCADSPAKPCRVRLSVDAEGDEAGSVVSGSCGGDAGESETSAGEKRTRFRTGHDDGSIGNTSDILEVISEATSDGSDGSSLEDADQYKDDNLSDMISANVSGRETPNVSGRNTPSSQVTDEPDTAAAPGGGAREPPARDGPQRSPTHGAAAGAKPPATVIEDKFGKFNIKPLNEDETVSMVSDTWSTDVLASDTETVEQVEAPLTSRQLLELCTGGVGVDVSETASEAWSTDVLGSDSERDRLAEVDAEDAASVTRSDDTARSEAAPAPAPTEPLKSSVSAPTFPAPAAPAPAAATARQERGRQMSGESVASDFSSASGLQRERGRTAAAAGRSTTASTAPASPQQQETPPRPARPATPPLQTPPDAEAEAKANGAGGEAGSSASSDSELPDPESNSVEQPPDSAGSESPLRPAATSSAATGAIPKSISFDKSAERGGRRNADEQARRGFFKNLKLPFKTRRKGSRELVSERLERGSGDGRDVSDRKSGDLAESSDDILAKYRRKTPDVAAQARMGAPAPDAEEVSADLLRLTIDPENVQASYAFSDAKRKLRRVLAAANVQAFPWGTQIGGGDSPLLALLRLQLSEYISLHDHALMAQLHETIRCVSLFDAAGCQALLRSLREDYNSRSRYIAYLVRCRDGLLTTLSHLRLTVRHVRRDQTVCTRALVDKCVLLFLERHKRTLQRFQASFQQAAASDEKTVLVARFLAHLSDELLRDADWQAADDHQLHLAREAIEQMVMAQIYTMALYPNGEADVSRDQVLTGHMRRLALVVTPGHPDLKIPRIYHYEQPWPSAQAEITALNAYKTARDKVACVTRCCATIMNLLHIASERSVPAADDLIPVLVFVLIKASPGSLLSTIQYVNSFYGERLEGEDLYWWTQFCSAAEFVKMMDY